MVEVKPIEPANSPISNLIRRLVYPAVPYFGVACLWAHAYSLSLESKLRRQLHSGDGDSYYLPSPWAPKSVSTNDASLQPAVRVTTINDPD